MKKIIAGIFTLITFYLQAQQPDTVTFYSIGGMGEDIGRGIYPTSDGGYIMVGTTESFGRGATDIYIVKTDTLNQIQFAQVYGGAGIDYATDVIQLPGKSYLICGYSNSFNAFGDYDGYLLKIDSLGNRIYEKTFGTSEWDFIYAITKNQYGIVVVCGETSQGGQQKSYIAAFNFDGQMLWENIGTSNGSDALYDVAVNHLQQFLLCGYTDEYNQDYNINILKINQMGDVVYRKTLIDTLEEKAFCIQENLLDTSWIIGGYAISHSTGIDSNEYILKFKDDSVYWSFQYDYAPGTQDFITDVAVLSNGDCYFAGYTNTSFNMPHITCYRVNIDGYPYLAENLRVHYPAGKTVYTPRIALHHDSAFALIAHSSFYSNQFNDMLFIPLRRPYSIIERDTVVYTQNIITSLEYLQEKPNNFYTSFGLLYITQPCDEITIYSVTGQVIFQRQNPPHEINLQTILPAEGIYIIDFKYKQAHQIKKVFFSNKR